MPLKCHIYATYVNYFMCRYETTISAHISNTNSLQWTMWPGILICKHSTLLAYFPEQIFLPHCTYMSHSTSAIVYIQMLHHCTQPWKITWLQHLSMILLQNMCQQQICLSNNHICNMPKLLNMHIGGNMSIYMPSKLSLQSKLWSVQKGTDRQLDSNCISWFTRSAKIWKSKCNS